MVNYLLFLLAHIFSCLGVNNQFVSFQCIHPSINYGLAPFCKLSTKFYTLGISFIFLKKSKVIVFLCALHGFYHGTSLHCHLRIPFIFFFYVGSPLSCIHVFLFFDLLSCFRREHPWVTFLERVHAAQFETLNV